MRMINEEILKSRNTAPLSNLFVYDACVHNELETVTAWSVQLSSRARA